MDPIFNGRDQQGVGMTSGISSNQYNYYGSPDRSGSYQQGGGSNAYDPYNQDTVMEKYFGGYQGSNTDQYNKPGNLDPYLTESSSGYNQPQFGRNSQYETPQQPMNDMTALTRIQGISDELDKQAGGEANGDIEVTDLQSALDDKSDKYSKEDKKAIQYLLENQNGLRGRLDSFDGNGDGTFKTDTINKIVANPNAQPEKTPEQKMSNTEAIRILKDQYRFPWDKIDREELSRMQNNEKLSPEERTMAKKLLQNEELFKAADMGRNKKGDEPDGIISPEDCDKLLNRSDLDKIGASSSGYNGNSGQPVIQGGGNSSYPPVNTGNYNQDYYYNSVFGRSVGPAADIFRSAPGGGQAA